MNAKKMTGPDTSKALEEVSDNLCMIRLSLEECLLGRSVSEIKFQVVNLLDKVGETQDFCNNYPTDWKQFVDVGDFLCEYVGREKYFYPLNISIRNHARLFREVNTANLKSCLVAVIKTAVECQASFIEILVHEDGLSFIDDSDPGLPAPGVADFMTERLQSFCVQHCCELQVERLGRNGPGQHIRILFSKEV